MSATKNKKRRRSQPSEGEAVERKDRGLGQCFLTVKKSKKHTPAPQPLAAHVDKKCPLSTTHGVYVGYEGTAFEVTLALANAKRNSNNLYRTQLLGDPNGKDYRT